MNVRGFASPSSESEVGNDAASTAEGRRDASVPPRREQPGSLGAPHVKKVDMG